MNTPKNNTFTIHIHVLDNNEFEYSPRGIHIGEEAQTVIFVANKDCDVVFLEPHYFKSDKVPLTKDADGPAHVKGRKPSDPQRVSKWQVWMLVNGKRVHLTTHAHAVVGATVSVRDSSGSIAVMDADGRGDPDPIIQP